MKGVLLTAALLIPMSWCAAQTANDPTLHKRSATQTQDQGLDTTGNQPPVPQAKQQGGWSSLPADASGEYELDSSGSMLQITIEDGKLSGYITRMLDEDSALTYFFTRASIHGSQISFATREVHGIWYSFDGAIVRGDARTNGEPGFYRLRGVWTLHDDAQKTESKSNVSFKSTPRDLPDSQP